MRSIFLRPSRSPETLLRVTIPMRAPIVALAALLSFGPAFGAAITWEAIPREELALTEPSVGSDAGVEVLFRETSVDESDDDVTITRTHVRYKVFDQRGVEALQKIDIRYDSNEARMTSIGARVIKTDGTVVDVERKSFFTREVVRNRYLSLQGDFVFPAGARAGRDRRVQDHAAG
jgi:Domain of Unknown Function with PDB structure (DUF3857)